MGFISKVWVLPSEKSFPKRIMVADFGRVDAGISLKRESHSLSQRERETWSKSKPIVATYSYLVI